MTDIVPEDGTGLADADSYVSVAICSAYHIAFGNAAWAAASPDDQNAALRRATQYIDTRYSFDGHPFSLTQALAWPRDCVNGLADDAWPVKRLSDATCELALRALTDSLYDDAQTGDVKSEKIGPIAVEYIGGAFGGQTQFTVVDNLLAPYLGGTGGNLAMRLERA